MKSKKPDITSVDQIRINGEPITVIGKKVKVRNLKKSQRMEIQNKILEMQKPMLE